jgi:hypothetical protein
MTTVDKVDVDAIVAAALACPAVVELHGGGPHVVATYLPGRRVTGVRVDENTVLVSVVLAYGPVASLAAEVRAAVAPHAGGRSVDVLVADVQLPDDPRKEAAADEPSDG